MKALCLNRISKDIKEINKSPLEGIGIISLDNDPMKYIVNIKIMTGIYEGYCLQLLLKFSDNYPIHPPKILIYPGQMMDNTYHHHIFKDTELDEQGKYFNKFCFDLLDNDFMPTSSQYTGWNPSYTISSFLLQIQTFLSDPDMSKDHLPNEEKIKELMKSMDNYEKIFIIKDNTEEIKKVHTWKNPYPEIYYKNASNEKEKTENKENIYISKLKENLSCYISKNNYIDDNNILLGYPIKKISSRGLIPIPQILSYDSFIEEELSKKNQISEFNRRYFFMFNFGENRFGNFDVFLNNDNIIVRDRVDRESFSRNYGSFKSANNEYYDSWLPIFINEDHFQKNKTTILNYFSILKFGNSGLKQYDFHTKYIFEIMPNILSEMINKMAKENISSSFLKCFFQYILLYKKLIEKNKNFFYRYQEYYLKYNINIIMNKDENIDTNKLLLELFFLIFIDNNKIISENNQLFKRYLKNLKNLICLELFDKNDDFLFENPKLFIYDLKKNNLFYKIVDIIFIYSDYYFKDYLILSDILRNIIITKMETNFKTLFNSLK